MDLIARIQAEQKAWAFANFGDHLDGGDALYGVGEEFGELCEELAVLKVAAAIGKLDHAYLKRKQGIRGTVEEHTAKLVDAFGDVLIYLLDLANREGIDAEEALLLTWETQVRKRNWKANAATGVA
jgi:NTP pyrophosphatase (non-canonical NTP hydrolase)